MQLSATMKNIIIGVSTAVILSMLSAMWIGIGKAQAGLSQLSVNTQAIESIGTAMELRGIDRVIENKSKEIRDKQVAILNAGDNPPLKQLLNTQISELQTEITRQRVIRECVVNPEQKVCK